MSLNYCDGCGVRTDNGGILPHWTDCPYGKASTRATYEGDILAAVSRNSGGGAVLVKDKGYHGGIMPKIADGCGCPIRMDGHLDSCLDGKGPKTAGKKDDTGKPSFDLLPFDALAEVHRVLEFGAGKYGARNWEKGFEWLRLANAAARHLFAWMKGEKSDPDTGQSHIAHLACCALFLLAHELRQIGKDDRR